MNINDMNTKWFIDKFHYNPEMIKVVLINEVVPKNEYDDFYENNSNYSESVLSLFNNAGFTENMYSLLDKGIYICNAVKTPKHESSITTEQIKASLDELEAELALFTNLQVIMLMGDVARKAFNMIVKRKIGKNIIPSGSTYKLRHNDYFYNEIQVMPSYICTGGNLLIEKSKVTMISEDIQKMMKLIGEFNE